MTEAPIRSKIQIAPSTTSPTPAIRTTSSATASGQIRATRPEPMAAAAAAAFEPGRASVARVEVTQLREALLDRAPPGQRGGQRRSRRRPRPAPWRSRSARAWRSRTPLGGRCADGGPVPRRRPRSGGRRGRRRPLRRTRRGRARPAPIARRRSVARRTAARKHAAAATANGTMSHPARSATRMNRSAHRALRHTDGDGQRFVGDGLGHPRVHDGQGVLHQLAGVVDPHEQPGPVPLDHRGVHLPHTRRGTALWKASVATTSATTWRSRGRTVTAAWAVAT